MQNWQGRIMRKGVCRGCYGRRGGDPTCETGGVEWQDGAGDAVGEKWIPMPSGSLAEGGPVTVERVGATGLTELQELSVAPLSSKPKDSNPSNPSSGASACARHSSSTINR